MSRSSFPRTVPYPGALFRSAGFLGRVPPPRRYGEGAPTSTRSSRVTSLRSFGGTDAGPACSLPSPCEPAYGEVFWPLFTRWPYPGNFVGIEQISQVPGESLCACPALRPRRSRQPQIDSGKRCCLPLFGRRRPPQVLLSRLNHAAHTLAIYASQPGSPHVHARLASGWRSPLPGGVLPPAGLLSKVSVMVLVSDSSRPPSPSFSWRNRTPGAGGGRRAQRRGRGRAFSSAVETRPCQAARHRGRAAGRPLDQQPTTWTRRVPTSSERVKIRASHESSGRRSKITSQPSSRPSMSR